MRGVLGALAAVIAALGLASPALAGGWATTLLDPLPQELAAGQTYTAGFWILQHGSHVSMIPLANPGLRLVDTAGKSLVFKGSPLHEGGHYATALAVPHDGTWEIYGMQSPFADYRVGVISLPGKIAIAPTPQPLPASPDPSWSTVKPPVVAGEAIPTAKPVLVQPAAQPAQTPAPPPAVPWALIGVGVLFGLAIAFGRSRLRGRTAVE